MPLRTTVIGSYPPSGSLPQDWMKNAIDDQLEVGLDVISDGQTRKGMIEYVAEVIGACESYQDGNATKWKIKRKIGCELNHTPLTWLREDFDYLRKRCKADGRAKPGYMIAGPLTMVSSCEPHTKEYGSTPFRNPEIYMDMAEAIIGILKGIGADNAAEVHIDEPFASQQVPVKVALPAIEYLAKNIQTTVNLHVCGDVTNVFPKLVGLEGIDVLSHAFMGADGQSNRELLDFKLQSYGKKLGVGCIDTASAKVESVDEVVAVLRAAMNGQDSDDIVVHPDCGLRGLGDREIAFNKLKAMCKAAEVVRQVA